jgi:hypothetical protein
MHPEDQKIVDIAKELCRQLNFYKINPQTINWREKIGLRRVPVDYFMIFPRGLSPGACNSQKQRWAN